MRGRRAGREEAVLEGGSGLVIGGHGPRTVTFSVAPRVTLCAAQTVTLIVVLRVTLEQTEEAYTEREREREKAHMQTRAHEHTCRGGGTEERRQRWMVVFCPAVGVTVRGQ